MKKIIVLISGVGENLQSLINNCIIGSINAQITAVISNKIDAYGIIRAQKAKIPVICLESKKFINRNVYDTILMNIIKQYSPDLIALAGFMRILTPCFINSFKGKILNIHPSLLPKYPGLFTHRKAIKNNDIEHGASVHFVTKDLDCGPVIIQAKVPIFKKDTEIDVIKRVKIQENNIYPLAVQWFISGRLNMQYNNAVLDGRILPKQGYINNNLSNITK
ncbi:Phosphoribosylglycinamide formyltransferase [Candidatus Providencia siddallii]|uniref:Phosphoribosylglycinamide formyltransferase n=1 Tax=Candidatus Providencia siddallii TaxID=1715285 RepID=A0A0M6W7L2_9GAMM|nr:Phosphoribosylglycinamide formyltransferase [Candidatus Providencia siddallii]